MMTNSKKNKLRGLVFAMIVGTLGVLGVAAPANAAYSDYCNAYSPAPYASGTTLVATAQVVCSSPRLPYYVQAQAQYFDNTSLSYLNFGSSAGAGNPSLLSGIGVNAYPYCGGMGSAWYRTQGYGENDLNEWRYTWSAESSIYC